MGLKGIVKNRRLLLSRATPEDLKGSKKSKVSGGKIPREKLEWVDRNLASQGLDADIDEMWRVEDAQAGLDFDLTESVKPRKPHHSAHPSLHTAYFHDLHRYHADKAAELDDKAKHAISGKKHASQVTKLHWRRAAHQQRAHAFDQLHSEFSPLYPCASCEAEKAQVDQANSMPEDPVQPVQGMTGAHYHRIRQTLPKEPVPPKNGNATEAVVSNEMPELGDTDGEHFDEETALFLEEYAPIPKKPASGSSAQEMSAHHGAVHAAHQKRAEYHGRMLKNKNLTTTQAAQHKAAFIGANRGAKEASAAHNFYRQQHLAQSKPKTAPKAVAAPAKRPAGKSVFLGKKPASAAPKTIKSATPAPAAKKPGIVDRMKKLVGLK